MSNTNCQELEISVEQGGNNTNYNQTTGNAGPFTLQAEDFEVQVIFCVLN